MDTIDDNAYLNGTHHACVTSTNVKAAWAHGPNAHRVLDATNRAFCIYYHARQALDELATDANYSKMTATLDDCLTEGWGKGVSDMKEALWHYAKQTVWTDENTELYGGGDGRCYRASLISNMPRGPANFMTALDGKLPELGKAMKVYQEKCDALKTLNGKSKSDWAKVRAAAGDVSKAADAVQHLAFLMPSVVDAHVLPSRVGDKLSYAAEVAESGATWVKRGVKFVDVLGKITDGLKLYDEAEKAFDGDEGTMMAYAGLYVAVNHIPIVGTFYGPFIEKFPGMINAWKEFTVNYHARTDDVVAWVSRPRPKPAWKCRICKSSGNYH